MKPGLRLLVAAGAVATMISAALVLSALNPAPSPLDRFAPPLAAAQDRKAELLLHRDPGAFDAATAASEAALTQSPYDTTALLRIALIDKERDGRLDAPGLAALTESYRRVPFDRTVSLWRIRFALECWNDLPATLRQSVQNEVFGVASEPGHVWPLRARLSRIGNPQGRVVASFWLARVSRGTFSSNRH